MWLCFRSYVCVHTAGHVLEWNALLVTVKVCGRIASRENYGYSDQVRHETRDDAIYSMVISRSSCRPS